MEQYAVELRNVTKVYNDTKAVDGVELRIRAGEFFSLLGPSGCGKTTTLRLIAGFEMPTSGEVWIDGRPVHDLPAYRRNVNTVFQSYSLFPHLDVFENIAFGLRRAPVKVAAEEIRQRVQEALDLVQLGDFGSRRVQNLSGGQQQRVALARALVNRPAVLLLDEPMAALDAKLRKEMRLELKRLQKSLGITFILVTHDQEEALTLSDHLAVVHRGRLEQIASPREIYETPATRFVAEFIGSANFLNAVVGTTGSQQTLLESPWGALAASARHSLAAGAKGLLTVRPERCHLLRQCHSEYNCMSVDIEDVCFLGAVTRVVVRLAEGIAFVVERPTAENLDFSVGEKAFLTWDAQAASLLPLDGAA